jgi:hypothetical protein
LAIAYNMPKEAAAFLPIQYNTGEKTTYSADMFECGDGMTTVHYTLVCDFRIDCPDESDELFCMHRTCGRDEYHCESGRCVPLEQRCKCIGTRVLDEKDCFEALVFEQMDMFKRFNWTKRDWRRSSLFLLDFNVTVGKFSVQHLPANATCPVSHFRCEGKPEYCVPLFTRCNGYNDCLNGEDEIECEQVTCAGLYRCRGSRVCLIPGDVCDGWEQCPQGDDEWLCDVGPCPDGCLCQGLAFLCLQPFTPDYFPALRYLEVQNAPFSMSRVPAGVRAYLVYLKVNNGTGVILPEGKFPNLQKLDLSKNNIEIVNMTCLLYFPNLKVLRLSNNPLTVLYLHDNRTRYVPVQLLDLSYTKLKIFDGDACRFFSTLERLNMSNSLIQSIGSEGFTQCHNIREVDLRKNPLTAFQFSSEIFRGLAQLSVVYTPNYRMCCAETLASLVTKPSCLTDETTLSSCGDLLRLQTHQVTLLALSLIAVIGNILCVIVRHFRYKEYSVNSTFSFLVNNLNVANLMGGLYASIIAFTDQNLRSQFIWHEGAWRRSAVCKLAGFLSVLSHSVSALTMLLITLERLVDLRAGTTSLKFGRKVMISLSLSAWSLGLALAVLPLIPSLTHWEYYEQSVMCVPLPCSFSNRSGGYHLFLNAGFYTVLVTLVTIGLIQIHVSLPHTSVLETLNTNDELTRVFLKIAVTDCVRLGMLSFASLLSYLGLVTVDEHVAASLAIFVLQLNSVLNPCLYLLIHLRADQKRANQSKLLKLLKLETNRLRD